jgi:ubiquinone/menaquinone biosynthesis C-methylase UbiE
LYDDLHSGGNNPEHIRALQRSWPMLSGRQVESVTDVGCGTGRSMLWLGRQFPNLQLTGVDPSEKLLEIARKRLPEAKFALGSAERLPLPNDCADLVLATGIMHHVDCPAKAIREMFRVARKAVLISDHNNFAFGGALARRARLWLYASGLLDVATFVKQGFRRQGYTKEDGWWYPYSLFNDFALIAQLSCEQYIIPTTPIDSMSVENLLLTQSHIAILAVKSQMGTR